MEKTFLVTENDNTHIFSIFFDEHILFVMETKPISLIIS